MDLIIGNYFQDGAHILDAKAGGVEVMHDGKAKALNGGLKHIFLWQNASSGPQPQAHYREVKDVLSPEVNRGWALAVGAADLDGDQLPEIYFAFDFGPDRLLHNRSTPGHLNFVELKGQRHFTTPKSCVLGNDSFKGMGVDFGDVNGDGLLDIYVSNIATKFGLTESHFLWLSTGKLGQMQAGIAPYDNASEKMGLSRSGWGWDARLADFDNDGVLEAIQAVGFIKGEINRWPELQSLGTSNDQIVHNPTFWPSFKPGADLSGHDTNPFFVRAADGRYYNIAHELDLDHPMVSRGIATAPVGNGHYQHIFNPSDFGVAFTLVIFPQVGFAPPYHFTENVRGLGDFIVPGIVLFTGILVHALFTGRLPLVAAWVIGFALQGLTRAWVFGTPFFVPLRPMTSAAFILFTLYMIPDPATTPLKPLRQVFFGFSVAVVYGFLQVMHLVFGLFFALVIVCAIRGLSLHIQAMLKGRRARSINRPEARSALMPIGLEPVKMGVPAGHHRPAN